jgi:YVTN family beta-propeller protein
VARRWFFAVGVAIAGLMALAPGALARNAYVANSGDGTVSVFDTANDAVSATIHVGGEPVDVAISPNGARAYVANKGNDSVDVIDTAASSSLVEAIPVGKEPVGIAASPDGHRVYVANLGDETVSAIDTGTNSVVGFPIRVGKEPDAVAISPDGTRLLVAQRSGDVVVLDTTSHAIFGSVPDPLGPSRLAIVPGGGRGFVTNGAAASVTAFTPPTGNLIGSPIAVGSKPAGIAIEPSGDTAYVASPVEGTVTPFDTSFDVPLDRPIGGFPGASGIAIRPDGLQGYVSNGGGSVVSILDTTRQVAIGAIPVGPAPAGIAVVPDQGPRASFFVSPARKRAKKAISFHGSGSLDPDGKIATYAWDFGDGGHAEGSEPTRFHRYREPGEYLVTLVVTDDEGCSTALVYTGQTASCNGSPLALASSTITVGDTAGPILRVGGAKTQALRGRVTVRARCPQEPCTMQAHGILAMSFESNGKTLHRSRGLRPVQVPQLSRSWRKLRLRVPPGARRAARQTLLGGGEVKAKISVLARDQNGEPRLWQRKVELVLP